jgi:hypothetical protein
MVVTKGTVMYAQQDDWRTAEFVSVVRAAHVLGYAPATVRKLISGGCLKAVRQARSGPMFVVVKSLIELIEAAEPVHPIEATQRTTARGTHLAVITGGRK